jgi:hypothetical protein
MGYKPEPTDDLIYTLRRRIAARPADKWGDDQPRSDSGVPADQRHQQLAAVARPRFRVARLLSSVDRDRLERLGDA